MNLERQYKLYKLGIRDGVFSETVDLLVEKTKNLTRVIFEMEKHLIYFFNSDGLCLFYTRRYEKEKSNLIRIRYEQFLKDIEEAFPDSEKIDREAKSGILLYFWLIDFLKIDAGKYLLIRMNKGTIYVERKYKEKVGIYKILES